jgi:hypothetical protein
MRSRIAILVVLSIGVAGSLTGCAPMSVSGTMQVRGAAPPPSFTFDSDPQFRYLSDRRVSVIADENFGYDMFSMDGSYFLYSNAQWYRSPSPRGHFEAVEERRVPRGIFDVDDHQYRWRNHPQRWRGQDGRGRDIPSRGGSNDRDGHSPKDAS